MLGYGKSDIGKLRANNEDAFYVNNEGPGPLSNLFVLADGMGGHNAGEIASKQAISSFCDFITKNTGFMYKQDFLAEALAFANTKVHTDAQSNPQLSGMGTTFSACTISENNLYYAHVGDSRIYIVKDGEIKQLTKDHSLVADLVTEGLISEEEAKNHPDKNVLMRAVGTDLQVIIDKGYYPLNGVDYVLLCSDGLTDMISDQKILDILQEGAEIPDKIDLLITAALEAGGVDNISAIVMGCKDK